MSIGGIYRGLVELKDGEPARPVSLIMELDRQQ